MDISKYLKKLSIDSFKKPDLSTLNKLHRNHIHNIPFENLDIHYKKRIVLNFEYLEKKILDNNRGGFCYELNGSFYKLLTELGYKVKMIKAGVYNKEGIPGPDYDHMALIVNINSEEYLADVGFGDSFIEPLKFEIDIVQKDRSEFFKIIKADDNYYILCSSKDSLNFNNEYRFKLNDEQLSNYIEMCNYHQTSPDSHFTQKRICTKATEYGRITLSDLKIIKTKHGIKTESALKDEDDFLNVLNRYFGIIL